MLHNSMTFTAKNLLLIWTSGELFLWGYCFLLIIVTILDCKFAFSSMVKNAWRINIAREDLFFLTLLLVTISFLVIGVKLDILDGVFALVNYGGAPDFFIDRGDALRFLLLSYPVVLVSTVLFCIIASWRYGLGVLRWFIYSLIFNVLAVIYLICTIHGKGSAR